MRRNVELPVGSGTVGGSAVPDPSSLALAVIGLLTGAGASWVRRRAVA